MWAAAHVFLYAEDSKVDLAIATIVRSFEQGKLPEGMRIGRAIYEDEKLGTGTSNLSTHQDWLSSISCIRRELPQVSEGRLACSSA